jgi:predicted Zn-dependent protease
MSAFIKPPRRQRTLDSILRISGLTLLLTGMGSRSLPAVQVLSPSTVPPGARVNQETANVEPSVRLLESLESLLPFKLAGSGIEDELLSAVRKFIAGPQDEAIRQFDEIRAKKTDFPPSGLIVAGLFFGAGDAVKARQWLEQTVVDYPAYPTTWSGLSRMAINEKRFADAEAILAMSDRLNQEGDWSEEQHRLFRKEFLDGMADVAIARMNFDAARGYLLEFQEMAPDNSSIALRLAQVEFDAGDVDKSLSYLREARVLSSEVRVPEAIIADWYTRKNNPEEAEAYLAKAMEYNPNDINVIVDRARWLLNSEKFAEALAMLARADEKGLNPLISQFMKGQAAFAQRDFAGAEQIFEALARQKPGDADTTNMLALSLAESSDVAKRERALELSMVNQRLYPRSVTAAATVGWIYYRLGRVKEAENVFQQVAQTTSNLEPSSAYFFAQFLNDRGEYKTAAALLQGAVASRNYFMYRAAAQDLLVKVNQALADAEGEGKILPDGGSARKPDGG